MKAPRTDANQKEIVDALRSVGASVYITAGVHKGFPDLCVGYRKRTWLLEVKDGSKPPSARKLTPAQGEFFASFRGAAAIVHSIEEALEVVVGYDPRVSE